MISFFRRGLRVGVGASVIPVLVAGLVMAGYHAGHEGGAAREAAPPRVDPVAGVPQRLSGTLEVDSFIVPAGTVVLVEDDWTVIAKKSIEIHGKLLVRSRCDHDTVKDGPLVKLEAAETIDVPGEIMGGAGKTEISEGSHGGAGSTIVLVAPMVHVDGRVVGGMGGGSGPSIEGGKGGDVVVKGAYLKRLPSNATTSSRSGIVGGHGGPGGPSGPGRPGGAGGRGGDALAMPVAGK